MGRPTFQHTQQCVQYCRWRKKQYEKYQMKSRFASKELIALNLCRWILESSPASPTTESMSVPNSSGYMVWPAEIRYARCSAASSVSLKENTHINLWNIASTKTQEWQICVQEVNNNKKVKNYWRCNAVVFVNKEMDYLAWYINTRALSSIVSTAATFPSLALDFNCRRRSVVLST